MKTLAICFLCCICTGCVSNTATRYTSDGKPWDKSRTVFLFARANAENFSQNIEEANGGVYKKTTTIAKPSMETQLNDLLGVTARMMEMMEKLMAKQATGGLAP